MPGRGAVAGAEGVLRFLMKDTFGTDHEGRAGWNQEETGQVVDRCGETTGQESESQGFRLCQPWG